MPTKFTSARFDLDVNPEVNQQPPANPTTPDIINNQEKPILPEINVIVLSDSDNDGNDYSEPPPTVPKKRKVSGRALGNPLQAKTTNVWTAPDSEAQAHGNDSRRSLTDREVLTRADSLAIREKLKATKEKLRGAREYKKRFEESQADLAKQQELAKTMANSNADLQKLLEMVRSNLDSTETQLEDMLDLKTQLIKKEQELDAASKDHETLRNALESARSENLSRLGELQRISESRDVLQSELMTAQKIVQEGEDKLHDLESRYECKQGEATRFIAQASLKEKDLMIAEEKIRDLVHKLQQYKQIFTKEEAKLKTALETVEEKDKEISGANKAKESAIQQMEGLNNTILAQSQELDDLKKQRSVDQETLQKVNAELKDARDTVSLRDREMSKIKAEIGGNVEEFQGIRDLTVAKVKEVATLIQDLRQLQQESDENTIEAKKMKDSIEKKDRELESLKLTLSNVNTRAALADALGEENNKLGVAIASTREDLEATRNQLAISQQELQKQRAETDMCASQNTELQKRVSSLESNDEDMQGHTAELKEKVTAAKAMSSQIEDFKSQLQTAHETIEQLRDHYDTCPIASNPENWSKFLEAWDTMYANVQRDNERLGLSMD